MKIKKNDIDLERTLMSGQAFRITKEEDLSFTCILSDRVVNIKEENDYLIIDSNNTENLEMIVKYYLDYGRDYNTINDFIKSTHLLKEVPTGYKILKQDKFEMLISYIISQNNFVNRISNTVNKISEKYGEKVVFNNKVYYLFPKQDKLVNLSIDDLSEFKLGFRTTYVYNALQVLKDNPFYLEELDMQDSFSATKELMKIKGIGLKVASCILLFGYSRFDTFPIDTWVKKYVSKEFNLKPNINEIKKFMQNNFKEYSGCAIQYMFDINRNRKLD